MCIDVQLCTHDGQPRGNSEHIPSSHLPFRLHQPHRSFERRQPSKWLKAVRHAARRTSRVTAPAPAAVTVCTLHTFRAVLRSLQRALASRVPGALFPLLSHPFLRKYSYLTASCASKDVPMHAPLSEAVNTLQNGITALHSHTTQHDTPLHLPLLPTRSCPSFSNVLLGPPTLSLAHCLSPWSFLLWALHRSFCVVIGPSSGLKTIQPRPPPIISVFSYTPETPSHLSFSINCPAFHHPSTGQQIF